MQAEQFDLAFQLHGGGGNSNPFVRRLGAQLSFGAQAPGASSLDVSVPYSYYHNDIQRWLEVVSYAGARTGDTEPQVVVLESDRKEANRMMRAKAVAKPYIVLHPGASDPRRRWPAEYFAWVARQLYRRGFSIVVTGITAEQMVVEAVVHQAAGAAIRCCGQLSLGGMAGLLAGAALVVSNDTGPLHLAAAVGAKTVGIYWIGNVIMAAEPTRMRHELLVDWTTDCPRCGRSCVSSGFPFDASACNHAVSFVSKVEPKAVLTSCLRLLGLIK
jgi:ADP-heptose:LPS heptosyltransferase